MFAEAKIQPAPQVANLRPPSNGGKLIGQKPPLKLREVWSIRIRLQLNQRLRDLAMFNLAIDSRLRGCDLVALRIDDVLLGVPFRAPGKGADFRPEAHS